MIAGLRSWGIRRKVLLLAVIPAATVAISLAIYFSVSQTQDLERSLGDRGLAIVRQLAPASEYGVFSGNADILRPLADAVMREPDVHAVVIRNRAGAILVRSGLAPRTASGVDPRAGEAVSAWSDDRRSRVFQAPIRQTELALDNLLDDVQANPGPPSAGPPGGDRLLGWVTVEMSRERTLQRQRQIWLSTGLIALVVLIVGAALAMRMGRQITEPIVALKDAVGELERGNFDVQVDSAAGGELGALEAGVEAMARALKASRENLQERIDQATGELREALRVLGDRNRELDAARREAESASRAKSAFLANISHEIRTPLNGIFGFLTLLSKTGIDQTQREYIAKIDASTKTLLALLNDILDFSKLEVARLKVVPVEFDVRELLDECVYVCAAEAEAKGLELVVFADADVPGRLRGGADRIAQVIKNLVSNAVKFTAGGEVVVRATLARDAPVQVSLRIAVTDTGIGITSEDRERLFQPFSQLDAGMSRRYGGTGLGLAIAKSLVELLHGSMTVDSTPGEGSCFAFTVPLDRCAPAATERARTAVLGGRRALVVSPNARVGHALRQTLAHWKMNVEHAGDAALAIGALGEAAGSRAEFDVVIVDAMLPSGDAARVVAVARARPDDRPPVLVLLDRADREHRLDPAVREEFTGCVSRPARSGVLGDLMCRVLAGIADRRSGPRTAMQTAGHASNTRPVLRVLLADDNPINRQFLATWLHQYGAYVDEVADGAEAIERCRRSDFDLILMDLHMPNVDGLEAAARIRDGVASAIPIVAITADATDDARRRLQTSGINDYLIKPVSEEELLRTLDRWCAPLRPGEAAPAAAVPAPREPDAPAVVDEALGLRLASGNVNLWHWSLRTLAGRLPQQLADIERALRSGDAREAREQVHSVAGAAGYCGAARLLRAAAGIEEMLIAGNPDEARRRFPELQAAERDFVGWVASVVGPESGDP